MTIVPSAGIPRSVAVRGRREGRLAVGEERLGGVIADDSSSAVQSISSLWLKPPLRVAGGLVVVIAQ